MSNTKVILSILAGFAAGAALGVLLAPDKGTVTRGKIIGKGKDAADLLNKKITGKVQGLTSSLSELVGASKPVKNKETAELY